MLDASPSERAAMIDLGHIDDLARRLSDLVPPPLRADSAFGQNARAAREELQQTFKDALQSGLARLDLVTREEFDVQRAVLLRTREKIDALEALLGRMEAQLPLPPDPAASAPGPDTTR